MTGKVIMPDEEYLQSWWYGVPLGTSETHSDRMECTANGWGTFIGIIALMKITVALTGGKTTLAKTLGALSVAGNIWTIKVFLPMNALMEAHWTNKKNNPAMENKGSVTPFCAMLAVESICWIIAQGLVTEPPKPKIH